jgi:surface carbohydrate biosynthesis protein
MDVAIWKGFLFFYKYLFMPKKWLHYPKKSTILICDNTGAENLMPYLVGYSVQVLAVRGEELYLPCVIQAIFSRNFWRGKFLSAYSAVFIKAVAPKICITNIDNNSSFYLISLQYDNITTIFIQNGVRSIVDDVFDSITENELFFVDYMFVHNRHIGLLYKRYIDGCLVVSGSFINNHIASTQVLDCDLVVYISQFRDKPNNNVQSWTECLEAMVSILDFLLDWCPRNGKSLIICGAQDDSKCTEKEFYDKNLKNGDYEYVPRRTFSSSYHMIDRAGIVVTFCSTLGYESIGRRKKTAVFTCSRSKNEDLDRSFGWPAKFPDAGPFWTNYYDIVEFARVMDYLNSVSDSEWGELMAKYADDVMAYDPANSHFTALLEQLL